MSLTIFQGSGIHRVKLCFMLLLTEGKTGSHPASGFSSGAPMMEALKRKESQAKPGHQQIGKRSTLG